MGEKRETEMLTSLADAIKGNVQLICERMAAMHKELRELRPALATARREERERCAGVAKSFMVHCGMYGRDEEIKSTLAAEITAAIRALPESEQ